MHRRNGKLHAPRPKDTRSEFKTQLLLQVNHAKNSTTAQHPFLINNLPQIVLIQTKRCSILHHIRDNNKVSILSSFFFNYVTSVKNFTGFYNYKNS